MTGSAPVRANKGETSPARIAHVPSGSSSHARADEWVRHKAGCLVAEAFPQVIDCECGGPLMFSPAGHDAITAELVACTLGHRVRPELQVPTLAESFKPLIDLLSDIGRRLSVAFKAAAPALGSDHRG